MKGTTLQVTQDGQELQQAQGNGQLPINQPGEKNKQTNRGPNATEPQASMLRKGRKGNMQH